MLDGRRKNLARLIQIVAGIEQVIDLGAVTRPLLNLVEIAVVRIERIIGLFVGVTLLFAVPVRAAPCGGDFNGFLAAKARDAQGQGISRGVIDTAFAGVTPDPAVLAFDRRQHGTFRQSFERYAATRVTAPRIKRAKILMQRHAALLSRVEQQFGVPATLLMAIWTMETDNGTGDMGKAAGDPHARHPCA